MQDWSCLVPGPSPCDAPPHVRTLLILHHIRVSKALAFSPDGKVHLSRGILFLQKEERNS